MYWANGTLVIDSNGISIGENNNWWDWVLVPIIPAYPGIANGVRATIGENGVRTSSTTVGKDTNGNQMHVENDAPGKRDGNIHIHFKGVKYYFDIALGVFITKGKELAPRAIQKLLEEEWVQKAIEKAKQYLGL